VDTSDFLDALQESPGERLDGPAYLAVRLVDLWLGDWDRHDDQYAWARFDSAGIHVWRPIPRDRDYAFVDYDGALVRGVRGQIANLVQFSKRLDVLPLLTNAAPLDHRLLGGVGHAEWRAATDALRARLTDAAVDSALLALPAEFRAREGAWLRTRVLARRDQLGEASEQLYHVIAHEAEAHGTDRADLAQVERLPTGNVRVTLRPAEGGAPYYDRELVWTETHEVRVYLHGGADVARVTGGGPEQVVVRVIGGGGDDTLRDETRGGHRTAFYDSDGDNAFARRAHTKVDEREWINRPWKPGNGTIPPRDWGSSGSLVTPVFGWGSRGVGPYVGLGPSWTRYGFRRRPYASKQQIAFAWAVEHGGRVGAEYQGDFRYVGSPQDRTEVLARASRMEASRFFGFGNDTERNGRSSNDFRVFESQLLGDAEYWRGIAPRAWIVAGVTGRVTAPDPEPGTPAGDLRPRGADDFYAVGGRLGLVLDRADSAAYPRDGWRLEAWGTGFPLAGQDASAFGGGRAVASTYLSAGARGPTLALRAGGERVWGGFPFQYAAVLGGSETLRGYTSERFAGDASAFGNAELRQVIARMKLLVRGDVGAFALADAGRVWYRGDSPGGWHTGVGGGLFFAFMDRRRAVSVAWAHGDEGTFSFAFGMPF
jgi:hypothetical protein